MALNCHDIAEALARLEPTAKFTVDGDTLADITWKSGSTPAQPTDQEITDEVALVQQERADAQYLANRRQAWRDQGVDPYDLLDALYEAVLDSDTTQADAYNVTRKSIKTQYPQSP